jgi:antitoxin HicB
MTPQDYLKLPYRRVIVAAEEGGFVAIIEEFPGCITQGDTLQETVGNLEEAATAWLECALNHSDVIPPPPAGLPIWPHICNQGCQHGRMPQGGDPMGHQR